MLHPESRLVAVGVEATFHCKIADSLEPYWVVNNDPGLEPSQVTWLSNRGFFIADKRVEGGLAMLSLKVNGTADKNGTVVFCSSVQSIRSNPADLLIITGISLAVVILY